VRLARSATIWKDRERLTDSATLFSMTPPALILVSAGLDLGGGGRALAGRLLASACGSFAAARGLRFEALTLAGPPPAPYGPTRDFGGRQQALAWEVFRRQLAWDRAARPELLVFDLLGPARIQAWIPSSLRTPYLVQLLGIEVWRPLSWDRRHALRGAATVVACSRYTLERGRPFLPLLRSAHVVPLALEERPPEGVVDGALLSRAGAGFLLMTGRMAASERYKGHDEVLAALPAVAKAQPAARLVIAGDGDDRPRLEARAAALGLEERVLFTGFAGEATLRELYERCAAFVLPSTGEGFGLVYLEAMRAGKPVVAARGGAAEEIVVEGTTGRLVDPADPAQLAGALRELLADPERARDLGEAGRARWRQALSFRRYEERMHPALADALQRPKSG
jgi:phosphatidylinositol alpha-1,6-mannosyltransferase